MVKKIFVGVVGILVVIQFIKPHFNNPKIDERIALQADEKVISLLKNACYDCHSDETKYPWYHNVAPISWAMAGHIDQGRKALNFSQWANMDGNIRTIRVKRAKQLNDNGLMPKESYLWMHENAHLKQEDKKILDQFFDQQLQQLKKS